MKSSYQPEDHTWNAANRQESWPDMELAVLRFLGPDDGWRPGMAPTALLRGKGHPSHVMIHGWPFTYVGTTDDGDTIYETI
jgi:hypothetical protein